MLETLCDKYYGTYEKYVNDLTGVSGTEDDEEEVPELLSIDVSEEDYAKPLREYISYIQTTLTKPVTKYLGVDYMR